MPWSMEMWLSLRMTRMSVFMAPALLRPSKAMPPVMAPSPMTATIFSSLPESFAATAMPRAAEMDVDECPTPKESNGLSDIFGKPLMPLYVRLVWNASRRPVMILWA